MQQSKTGPGRVTAEQPRLRSVERYRDGAQLIYEFEGQRASLLVGRSGSISFPHVLNNWGESLGTEEADEAVREAARLDMERAKLASLLGGRS